MAAPAFLLSLVVVALVLAPSPASAALPRKLPSYVKTCSIKDPNLNDCAVRNGREVLPHVVGGDPTLHLPSLDPLTVPEIRVEAGTRPSTFTMLSRNIVITGLADTYLQSVEIDRKNSKYVVTCSIPRLEILSDYEVDGQVLVLPIKGNGKSNFTFENSAMRYVQPYKLVKKGDLYYHEFPTSSATFNCTRAHFRLDNLFNGDKVLGETVNNFLNEHWREVVNDLSEPFIEATAAIIRQFGTTMVNNVPYSEIFNDVEM